MSSFLQGAGRAVEGFPCQALFQGNSCRATSFPGAAILAGPFSGPHRNGWEAAEAQVPALVPHGPGFPGAVHIPVAHCSAVDQSEVRGAWGVTREAKSCGGFGSCLIPASPVVDFVPVSSLQVHGHVTAKGSCLGASHALSVHTHSLFQGLPAYNPTWKGKLGACQGSSELLVFCLKINLAED